MTALCPKCGKEKEPPKKTKRTYCKSCTAEYARVRRITHAEDTKKANKKWQSNNKDVVKKNNADFYAANREREKQRAAKWRSENKIRVAAASKAWIEKNKEKVKENKRAYREKNKTAICEYRRLQYANSGESERMCAKIWKAQNKHLTSQLVMKRMSAKLNATPKWANDFFIKEIYHLARLREKATGFKWHVDHIIPLQSKLVCGLHCEANLQVIPASKNLQKSNRIWPNMP